MSGDDDKWEPIGAAAWRVMARVAGEDTMNDTVKKFALHVKLKRCGNQWIGKSPFCKEKTASFCVNPYTKKFHCFASGTSGTYEDFLRVVSKGLRLQ